jgi:uncharacterized membrane protein
MMRAMCTIWRCAEHPMCAEASCLIHHLLYSPLDLHYALLQLLLLLLLQIRYFTERATQLPVPPSIAGDLSFLPLGVWQRLRGQPVPRPLYRLLVL